jgi:hypothetical protein
MFLARSRSLTKCDNEEKKKKMTSIVAQLNTLVTTPSLFFALYLTLSNTFLAVTHAPLDPMTRYDFAETYVSVLSVFLFHMFVQARPQALPLIEALAKMTIAAEPTTPAPQKAPHFLVEDASSSSSDDM